eukprot:g42.t1
MSGPDEIIKLDEGYAEVESKGIKPFIALIEKNEREFFKAKDFVALYDKIFKMCIQRDPYNWSEPMYERYTKAIENYLIEKVAPSFNEARDKYDVAFLQEWVQRWHNQKLIVGGLSKLFMYLDRFYTPNTDGVRKLQEQGYWLYKEKIFDEFKKFAYVAILNGIEKERKNEEQDRHLLQSAVNVFVEMGYQIWRSTSWSMRVRHTMSMYTGPCAQQTTTLMTLFHEPNIMNSGNS